MCNPFSLQGKTILITGASSGIGRATAVECSRMGANCIITGRNQERLQQTFDSLEGNGHKQIVADLTVEDDLNRIIEEVSLIDGLVNNAGIGKTKPITFIKQQDLDTLFSTNTFAPVLLTKMLMKNKKIRENGSIVFTSSIAAMSSNLGNAVYGMSKAAVTSFVKYCAFEFSNKNIRVNSVHPGMVNTEMNVNAIFSNEELEKDMAKYPLKRYGQPEEIAWAIIYLLSDASKWVTGTQLIVDGGMLLV